MPTPAKLAGHLVGAPGPAWGADVMIWRIGYIEGGGPATRRQLVAAFTRRLNDLGYQDAQYAIDPKYAEGRDDRLAALAAELLATRPDAHRLKPWPAFLDDFQRHWPTDDDIYVDFVREAHSVTAQRARAMLAGGA